MNQPWNEIKASQIAGVVLDCNLSTGAKIGGGTATDNITALNAFLATASATNPIKLILDGPTLISETLTISANGYTCIEGIGWTSGIFIASGSNADPLNNGKITPMDPGTTPPASGAFIELRNFQINGNRGNGTTGDSNSGNPRGVVSPQYWYCNITLSNINGVRIENMYIYDAPAYSIRLDNCSDVVIANCTMINPNTTSGFNNDCVHIDGPATDIRIFGNYMNNNYSDDGVAINAPEGYGGVIDRVVIQGNTFSKCLHACRIYGSSGTITAPVYKVDFSGNSGDVSQAVMYLGAFTTYAADTACQVLTMSNNIFSVAGPFLAINGNPGNVSLVNCVLNSPSTSNAFVEGQFPATISNLTINGCSIYRNTVGNAAATMLSASAALTITRLNIDDFQIVNEQGQSYAAVAALLAMTNVTITALFIGSLSYLNVTTLADSYTNIAAITGAWQPESNIQSKTGAYTILPVDRTILASTTAGSYAVTLPAKAYAGQKHTIKNTGTANTLTITGTVDGSANPTLTTLASMTVLYDGTAFWKI